MPQDSGSVQPIGNPISHSTKRGFKVRPDREDFPPLSSLVGPGRPRTSHSAIDAATESGVPSPFPFVPFSFSASARASHFSGSSPSLKFPALGVGHRTTARPKRPLVGAPDSAHAPSSQSLVVVVGQARACLGSGSFPLGYGESCPLSESLAFGVAHVGEQLRTNSSVAGGSLIPTISGGISPAKISASCSSPGGELLPPPLLRPFSSDAIMAFRDFRFMVTGVAHANVCEERCTVPDESLPFGPPWRPSDALGVAHDAASPAKDLPCPFP